MKVVEPQLLFYPRKEKEIYMQESKEVIGVEYITLTSIAPPLYDRPLVYDMPLVYGHS
jgi:hypothetical protein